LVINRDDLGTSCRIATSICCTVSSGQRETVGTALVAGHIADKDRSGCRSATVVAKASHESNILYWHLTGAGNRLGRRASQAWRGLVVDRNDLIASGCIAAGIASAISPCEGKSVDTVLVAGNFAYKRSANTNGTCAIVRYAKQIHIHCRHLACTRNRKGPWTSDRGKNLVVDGDGLGTSGRIPTLVSGLIGPSYG
jgi:hypothetical protein